MADDALNMAQLRECIERIERRFQSDTFILLDRVLTDDPIEPEYSANTAYFCLEDVVTFHKLYFGENVSDVSEFLRISGYSAEDIELLEQKRIDEDMRYNRLSSKEKKNSR